jgi:exodeoxyribonuclease VII large subunit
MTLRDAVADISIQVTCSRTLFDGLNPPLVEGASIVVHAKPSYYANRGTLSLYARDIRMVGLGELLARLERRRQLLAAEGLFAAELKRRLPFLPGRVGLVTAPSTAAERDVLENARRRWPAVDFEVAYAAMQGPRCVPEVVESLERLDRDPSIDVIVVARGGGSVEDLLPFSDEALIRAVHRLTTPVVSAIAASNLVLTASSQRRQTAASCSPRSQSASDSSRLWPPDSNRFTTSRSSARACS